MKDFNALSAAHLNYLDPHEDNPYPPVCCVICGEEVDEDFESLAVCHTHFELLEPAFEQYAEEKEKGIYHG